MMAAEAKRIDAALPRARCAALDERGRDLTTVALSQKLEQWRAGGGTWPSVGGPDGLDAELKASCGGQIRLSSLTLPHPMVRVVCRAALPRLGHHDQPSLSPRLTPGAASRMDLTSTSGAPAHLLASASPGAASC